MCFKKNIGLIELQVLGVIVEEENTASYRRWMVGWMDGWIPCDLTSIIPVFQSYQDDVRMIMKGCVQWNSVYG